MIDGWKLTTLELLTRSQHVPEYLDVDYVGDVDHKDDHKSVYEDDWQLAP